MKTSTSIARIIPAGAAALALALALGACGSSATTTSDSTESEQATSEAVATESAAESTSTESSSPSMSSSDLRTADTLAQIFTIGYAGVGSDGNYYYLATDQNVSYAAFVILSQDGTQSMNAVGQVVQDGNYLTVNDTTSGYSVTFEVQKADSGIQFTLKDGTTVLLGSVDPSEVCNIIVAIDQNTQIVNPLANS